MERNVIMTLVRARRSGPVVPIAVLLAAVGLLLSTVMATPGSWPPSFRSTTTHGVNVFVEENGESASAWQTNATNEMKGINSLHANAIAIVFPFYTPSLTANCVYANTINNCNGGPFSLSPSPTRLAVLILAAQKAGLHVLLRPLMDETDLSPDWRGDIQPSSRTAWFASYEHDGALSVHGQNGQGNWFHHLAQARQSGHDLAMVVGHHLGQEAVQRPARLRHELEGRPQRREGRGPRGHLRGHGLLSGHHESHPFVDGGPAAFRVELLPRLHKSTGRRIQWRPSTRSASRPDVLQTPYIAVNGTFNPSIQANWFKAACDFYKAHKQSGIYFWGPNFTYNSGNLMTSPIPASPNSCNHPPKPPSRPASHDRGAHHTVSTEDSR